MDYRKLAVDELRKISALRTAEVVCRDRLSELNDRLHTLKIPSPQAAPVQGGGNRTEEQWLNVIASKSDEERRLRSLRRRLKRFDLAWNKLTDRDKAVLDVWYITGGRNAAEAVANREHCDRSTAFRWRDEAIISFARTFYGEVVT